MARGRRGPPRKDGRTRQTRRRRRVNWRANGGRDASAPFQRLVDRVLFLVFDRFLQLMSNLYHTMTTVTPINR